MSQRSVERILGRLVADEEFRRRFAADPRAELAATGLELTPCETRALAHFDARAAERCARAIDPRLVKADLGCGVSRAIGKAVKSAHSRFKRTESAASNLGRPEVDGSEVDSSEVRSAEVVGVENEGLQVKS